MSLGLPQNLDNFKEHTKNTKHPQNDDIINGPKPVFQNRYKRRNSKHCYSENQVVTPQQEEIIKYINDSWNCVSTEGDSKSYVSSSEPESDNNSTLAVYYQDEPATALKNFKPFDLESWWGKRLFTYITNSVNTN